MKIAGILFAIIAWLVWVFMVVGTAGIALLSLLWLLPGLAIAHARNRTWYNAINWLMWAGPLGFVVLFFEPRRESG